MSDIEPIRIHYQIWHEFSQVVERSVRISFLLGVSECLMSVCILSPVVCGFEGRFSLFPFFEKKKKHVPRKKYWVIIYHFLLNPSFFLL